VVVAAFVAIISPFLIAMRVHVNQLANPIIINDIGSIDDLVH
jgi:hypothetical protein